MSKPLAETLSDAELERVVRQALRRKGWLLPETADDVVRVEQEFQVEDLDFPETAGDPLDVLDEPTRRVRFQLGSRVNDEAITEHLALAARDGGKVSPEIRARMDLDRENAERKLR